MKEGRINELEEWQKHVVLIFDEMHIKEDLVFDKATELKGFIRIGNINDHLLNLENALSGDANHLPLSWLEFSLFLCPVSMQESLRDLLYPLVWEAVRLLESCGFKVLATICDGASSNHHCAKNNVSVKFQ